MANPIFNFRMDPEIQQGIKDHARRRGMTTSQYLRPLFQYVATLDEQDAVWDGLHFMRLPKVEKKPIPRN